MPFAHSRQNADTPLAPLSAYPDVLPAISAPAGPLPQRRASETTHRQNKTALPAAGKRPQPADTAPEAALRQTGSNPPAEIMDKLDTVWTEGLYKNCATLAAQLLNSFRESPYLWNRLGRCHLKLAAWDAAQRCLDRALELCPDNADTLTALGDVWNGRNTPSTAETYYLRALKQVPNRLETLNNLGNLLHRAGRSHDAVAHLQAARDLVPDNAVVVYNLGNALRKTGQIPAAIETFEQALMLDPDLRSARYNLAQLLYKSQQLDAALPQYENLLATAPEDDRARARKLHIQAQLNDWSTAEEYAQVRRHLGLRGTPVPPFSALALEDNPDLQRLRTQAFAARNFAPASAYQPNTPARPATRPARLRIGYFSADFHNHATMHLMAGLFRNHDTARFDIHVFSYGPVRNDEQQQRLRETAGHFHDCSDLNDSDLIALAQSKDLDIAVDLKGYTGDNRSQLFASRLARLHVAYLGYPGTMGTPAYDYIVTDSVVSPLGSERHFDECLLRMPHSYQPNDDRRQIASRQFTRADCGLPEGGFVFACFNNSYKITAAEFDIWMPLLAEVDGSVLWLLSNGATSEANLRKEAAARGVDPARLIFASRMPQDEHLARQKAADLFLDTFNYNAHTTGSDALWAGLPVLTLPGQQFAARVGASLLSACGLPELIAENKADYRARALYYAQNDGALLALQSRLRKLRRIAPLFDSKTYTRDLERGFETIFDRHLTGQVPAHVTLSDMPQSKPAKASAA